MGIVLEIFLVLLHVPAVLFFLFSGYVCIFSALAGMGVVDNAQPRWAFRNRLLSMIVCLVSFYIGKAFIVFSEIIDSLF